MLGAGLGFLLIIHLLHRIDNALTAVYHITTMQFADLTGLVIGQYLVPMLLLIYIVRLQRSEVPRAIPKK